MTKKKTDSPTVTNSLTATRIAFTKLQTAYRVSQEGVEGKKEALKLVTEAEGYVAMAKLLLGQDL